MNKSIFSKIVMGLLLLAIPAQGLFAEEAIVVAETKQGRIKQMQNAMKSFQKTSKNFLNCLTYGKCDSERQEKLAAELRDITKKLLYLTVLAGGAYLVRQQLIKDFQAGKQDFLNMTRTEVAAFKADLLATLNAKQAELEGKISAASAKGQADLVAILEAQKADIEARARKAALDVAAGLHGTRVAPGVQIHVPSVEAELREERRTEMEQQAGGPVYDEDMPAPSFFQRIFGGGTSRNDDN